MGATRAVAAPPTRRGARVVAVGRAVASGLRLAGAGLVGGIVAGALAGVGARSVMYLIRLMNPRYNGVTTHAGFETGRWTLDGTLTIVLEGALLMGIPGGIAYLIVRRWMPGSGWRKGLAFGLVILVVGGPLVIDGSFEFFRYVSPRIAVGLFATLFPLFGLVVAPVTERLGRGTPGPPRNRVVAWTGYLLLGVLLAWSAWRDLRHARDVLHLFG